MISINRILFSLLIALLSASNAIATNGMKIIGIGQVQRAMGGANALAKKHYLATVPDNEILPIVDANYESNVKGIHVIGDVTGLPLVKVAANQGADVIAKMERRGLFGAGAGDGHRLDIVIVGAGPAGLSAAVEAQKRGLRYVVLERNAAASTVRSFPPGKKVYAEPRFLKNASELPVEGDRAKDDFLQMIGYKG